MSNHEEIIVNEKMRRYTWVGPGNDRYYVEYENVIGVRVSESGNHYLRLKDGDLRIVKPTWDIVGIIPEAPETGWTF